MTMTSSSALSKKNGAKTKTTSTSKVVFKGIEIWPLDSGATPGPWKLDLKGYGATGVLVFRVKGKGLEEVLCAWTPGITLTPSKGSEYRAFFLGSFVRPTVADIVKYLRKQHPGDPDPTPIIIHPPKPMPGPDTDPV
jgi:hypothetical protein